MTAENITLREQHRSSRLLSEGCVMRTYWTLGSFVVAAALSAVLGCGGRSSDSQSLDQIRQDAAKWSVDDLKAKAKACNDEIAKYQKRAGEITAEISKIKLADLRSDAAMKLKTESADVAKSLDNVKQRLQIYVEELKKKGADVTGLITY
jgi:hypothetical protein